MITILIWIAALVLALLLLAALMPKHYSVTVTETILAPKAVVMDYVARFSNQLAYSEWLMHDTSLKPDVIGVDGTVGAIMRWESTATDKKKSAGKGEQEILRRTDDEIEVALRLFVPMEGKCVLLHQFAGADDPATTRYTCVFSTYAPFPINLPAVLIGRHMIRRTQQQTLRNIRKQLEPQAENA